jgi:hypothetical protein
VTINDIVRDMNANCTLGRFDQWRFGQRCLATQIGSGVTSLKGCEAFEYAVATPEDALRRAAAQFSCLDVVETSGSVSVSLRPGSTATWNDGTRVSVLCGCTADQIQALGNRAP